MTFYDLTKFTIIVQIMKTKRFLRFKQIPLFLKLKKENSLLNVNKILSKSNQKFEVTFITKTMCLTSNRRCNFGKADLYYSPTDC